MTCTLRVQLAPALSVTSPRQIAMILSADGIVPPGAWWRNRTTPQKTTWAFNSIIGHRQRGAGILRNVLYIGKVNWNRTAYPRDPDTKTLQRRVHPAGEWVQADAPELRIVPQDLWNRAQLRLALNDLPRTNPRQNVGKYLLSGFVKCAVCGGSYIKMDHSSRCTNHRNRDDLACTNRVGVTVLKLDRIVIAALRERLHTPENLAALIAQVRDELLARAQQEKREKRIMRSAEDRAKQLARWNGNWRTSSRRSDWESSRQPPRPCWRTWRAATRLSKADTRSHSSRQTWRRSWNASCETSRSGCGPISPTWRRSLRSRPSPRTARSSLTWTPKC